MADGLAVVDLASSHSFKLAKRSTSKSDFFLGGGGGGGGPTFNLEIFPSL